MNVDSLFSEGELATKLRKINKLTTGLVSESSRNAKTLVTKGLLDSYRLLVEAVETRKPG